MILTGTKIIEAVEKGEIIIEPFNINQVGTNSYDFKLGNRCRIYKNYELDTAKENPTEEVQFNEEGILLSPKILYLFNTAERMGSNHYVPIIRGRSSVGRLGVFIDITADLIDVGSINHWTLQLHCVAPVRVYPNMLIGQVTFWCIEGDINLYSGKYKNLESPVASLSFIDITKKDDK